MLKEIATRFQADRAVRARILLVYLFLIGLNIGVWGLAQVKPMGYMCQLWLSNRKSGRRMRASNPRPLRSSCKASSL
jgi:hypothetical protein